MAAPAVSTHHATSHSFHPRTSFIPNLKSPSRTKPRPTHFLVRPTGEIVPLVAVDEFPPGTNLVGVPRTLELEATQGMLNLGLISKEKCGYYEIIGCCSVRKAEVRNGDQTGTSRNRTTANIEDTDSDLDDVVSSSRKTSSPPIPPNPAYQQSLTDSTMSTSSSRQHHSQPLPYASISQQSRSTQGATLPQSSLCRHWCHHGICKWGQQCRYKHMMPMSVTALSEVGLRDWPSWYRSLNPGYFVDSSVGLSQPSFLPHHRNIGLKNARQLNGQRVSIDAGRGDMGKEIARKLREMGKEQEKEGQRTVKMAANMEKEKVSNLEVVRRVEREKKISDEGRAKVLAVEKTLNEGIRRWEDDEASEEETEIVKVKEALYCSNQVENLVDL